MQSFIQDLRYGARLLRRNPGFTTITVLLLAIGCGANTAVFSIISSVVMNPLPYPEPEGIYQIESVRLKGGRLFSAPDLATWQQRTQVFETMAAVNSCQRILGGVSEPEQLGGVEVSRECLPMLRTAPKAGRWFSDEDFSATGTPAVLIGDNLCRRLFGDDTTALGRAITLDGLAYTVIGVMPAAFQFTNFRSEFWIPLHFSAPQLSNRNWSVFEVYARAKPRTTNKQINAEAESVSHELSAQFPESHQNWRAIAKPLREVVSQGARANLIMLMGAVSFVLLLACVHIANLLLARSMNRSKEIVLRAALGAPRMRIVRQLLTESILISILGTLCGIVVAIISDRIVVASFSEMAGMPHLEQTTVNSQVLCFTLLLCIICNFAFGLIPALHATKIGLHEALSEVGCSGRYSMRSRGFRNFLLLFETGLSLILIIGACLMLKSLRNQLTANPGFDYRNVLTLQLPMPAYRFPDKSKHFLYYKEILNRVQQIAGTNSVALVTALPLSGTEATIFVGTDRDIVFASSFRAVTPNYFQVMRIPIIAGRSFSDSDSDSTARVAIVNRALAEKMWPGQDPIGKKIPWGKGVPVVGEVANVNHKNVMVAPQPEIYFSFLQYLGSPQSSLVVRADSNPVALIPAIRTALRALEPDQPLTRIRTMEEYFYGSLIESRFYTVMLVIFGAIATALAVAGIYGVSSIVSEQRKHEVGIRMALGARKVDIAVAFLFREIWFVILGIAAGIWGSISLTQLLSKFLFGVTPADPSTYFLASTFVFVLATLAMAVPVYRASNLSPMTVLRQE